MVQHICEQMKRKIKKFVEEKYEEKKIFCEKLQQAHVESRGVKLRYFEPS